MQFSIAMEIRSIAYSVIITFNYVVIYYIVLIFNN